jgi:hypothetical protein
LRQIPWRRVFEREHPDRSRLNVGAFLLVVAGMIASRSRAPSIQPRWLLALIAWPAVTAIPAFLVVLLATTLLSRRASGADARAGANARTDEAL